MWARPVVGRGRAPPCPTAAEAYITRYDRLPPKRTRHVRRPGRARPYLTRSQLPHVLAAIQLEKEPRAAAKHWYERGEAHANDTEVLLWALLVCISRESVWHLDQWVKKVLKAEFCASEMMTAWKPLDSDWSKINGVSTMYQPLVHAFTEVSWPRHTLDAAATAIQAWRRSGQFDGLDGQALSRYISSPPPATRMNKKRPPPPRYRSWAVVRVARLLHDHGAQLRKLLDLDAESEQARPLHEVANEQEQRIATLEATLAEKEAAVRRLQDAWRQAAKRLKEKSKAVTEARRDERAKAAATAKAAAMAKLDRDRDRMARSLESAYAADMEAARVKANNAHAQKRAQVAEAQTETARVKRKLRRVENRLDEIEAKVNADDEMEVDNEMEIDEEGEQGMQHPDSDDGFDPTTRLDFELVPRRGESGRFQAESPDLHAVRLAQMARGCSPSLVAENMEDIIQLLSPGAEIPAPCKRTLQRMRGEVTICGEAMAAFKFAKCKRVLFAGWDESTKFGNSVFAMTFMVEYFDGRREEVCLRGLTLLPAGGTSKAVLEHIETRIFTYSRHMLQLWIDEHEKVNGVGSWTAAGGPPVDNIGLHRLAEDTVLMTDTCNAARCTRRLLGELIMRTMQEKIGAAAWDAMSIDERNAKFRFYKCDCWQHLRNILIEAMSQAGTSFLKGHLSESLQQFTSFERIEVDAKAIVRAAFKQFHHGGEYAKGRGREFEAWRKLQKRSGVWIPFERAMGSRQDLAFDGCVPLYLNRLVCLEFLRGYIDCPKSQNVLDKSLFTLLKCNEFVAMLRANTLWQLLFSEPFRWLAGKTGKLKGWSLWNMSGVLDLVEGAMEKLAADPSKLLDPSFDMFGSVADVLPEFKAWREELMARTITAEDGTTEIEINVEVLRRARSPEADGGDEQATDVTLELIKEMAMRALEKLHDKKIALADKLASQGGLNAIEKRQEAASRTQGIDGTNDRSENKFATADFIMRTYRGIAVFNASGLVQQRVAHDFDRPARVVSDRRKRKATASPPEPPEKPALGFFWTLDTELKHSLVNMARCELAPALSKARLERQQHDEEKLSKREQAVQRQLNAVVEQYAEALELFQAWQAQGWKDAAAVKAGLAGKSISEQLRLLRLQIEMRTKGCGWRQFETKWGFNSDEKEQTIDELKTLLKDVMVYERTLARSKKLPTEAALPQLSKRALKVLGTVDRDAARIEAASIFNTASLLPKAEAARARREAAGISDRVEAQQQEHAPAFDVNLVGKWLQVCWPYKLDGKTHKIWASGRVKKIADGLTDTKSARARKVLPAGAVLWAWEADPEYDEPAGEEWLFLRPEKWNAHNIYGWRFDECELAPQGAARPPPSAPRHDPVDPYETDAEYDPCDDFE